MRALIAVFVALSLLSFPASADGGEHWTTGEEMRHRVALCLDLSDALAIVNAHRDSGPKAAAKLWADADRCTNITVMGGPKVGKVVHVVEAAWEGAKVTIRVVEVLHPDGAPVLGYFLTILEVRSPGRGV